MTLTKSRLEELRAQATSDLETLKTNLDQERAKGVIELLDEVERLSALKMRCGECGNTVMPAQHLSWADEVMSLTAELDQQNTYYKLFKEWEELLGPMPGVRIRELLAENKSLQAEITRLHEKYDFQELVKREERLSSQLKRCKIQRDGWMQLNSREHFEENRRIDDEELERMK